MPEPSDAPDRTSHQLPDAAGADSSTEATPAEVPGEEGPSEAVRAVRERFGEAPRSGSLRKPEPGQGLALLGILACAWAPFILWWFFGPLAFVLGALAYRRGEKRAKWLMVAAVVCTVAGVLITQLPDTFVTS